MQWPSSGILTKQFWWHQKLYWVLVLQSWKKGFWSKKIMESVSNTRQRHFWQIDVWCRPSFLCLHHQQTKNIFDIGVWCGVGLGDWWNSVCKEMRSGIIAAKTKVRTFAHKFSGSCRREILNCNTDLVLQFGTGLLKFEFIY